jgi:predicted CoA-substrate-specific enzyme activase
MKVCGIDIGSLSTKVALVDDGKVVYTDVERSTHDFKAVGKMMFDRMLEKQGLNQNDIDLIVGTGYGRYTIDFAQKKVTEITAHARGVQYYIPEVKGIIDIGGQDSKAMIINPKTGKVLDFQMNDKCAAGTGRFLEIMAKALETPLEDFGKIALTAKKIEPISSMCTVFAETEVISLFAQGAKKEDIIAGIHDSIAKRVASMAKRVGVSEPLVFCGGVAKNIAVKTKLEEHLKMKVITPDMPQMTGAIGAALLGYENKLD